MEFPLPFRRKPETPPIKPIEPEAPTKEKKLGLETQGQRALEASLFIDKKSWVLQ